MGRERKKFASAPRSIIERWMTHPALILIVGLFINACSPILSGASLIHSITKGDTVGTLTSAIQNIVMPQKDQPQKKSKADIMEDLRKALGETDE
ncbi:hypothetical protein OAV13_01020 [bacterium]|nr:hypothetical protein [bacterium]